MLVKISFSGRPVGTNNAEDYLDIKPGTSEEIYLPENVI